MTHYPLYRNPALNEIALARQLLAHAAHAAHACAEAFAAYRSAANRYDRAVEDYTDWLSNDDDSPWCGNQSKIKEFWIQNKRWAHVRAEIASGAN